MSVELIVPDMGESISEVQIGEWLVSEGDHVEEDDPLCEIESEKATVELPSPVTGTLTKIEKQTGDEAKVGDVIGYMEEGEAGGGEEDGAAEAEAGEEEEEEKKEEAEAKAEKEKEGEKTAAKSKAKTKTKPKAKKKAAKEKEAEAKKAEKKGREAAETKGDGKKKEKKAGDEELRIMPAAKAALEKYDVDASAVQATGPGGRLLKEDVLRHVQEDDELESVTGLVSSAEREEEAVKMSPMRRTIAERLVSAQQSMALLTTINDIDMSAVVALRNRYKDPFQEKYGIKLGFMSFFVKASIEALKEAPQVNAEIRGEEVVYKNYYDIGVAVGGGKGLVVPVLRNAERMSFAEIELAIDDFARRAQENKLSMDELKGGTFTISNGGIYGSLLSTPIINPPQSGILGMHRIEDRPVAVDGQVVIRPMMYVALTYDHRIVDGRGAVACLKRIKECVEDPTRIMFEI